MSTRGSSEPIGAPIFLIETTTTYPTMYRGGPIVKTRVLTSKKGFDMALAAVKRDIRSNERFAERYPEEAKRHSTLTYRTFTITRPQWQEYDA